MKCPRCGAELVKKLPDNLFYYYDSQRLYVVPVVEYDVEIHSGKKIAKVTCPSCGYTLYEKVIE